MRTLILIGLLALVSATTYFKETFDDSYAKRWVVSKWKQSSGEAGKFGHTAGEFYGDAEADKGLATTQDARFYAASAKFPSSFSNEGKDLVIQFSVKFPQKIDCGGGYIKVLPSTVDQENFGGDSPYNIMFGPDICGHSTKKVHVIFHYPKKGENLLVKKEIRAETDQLTHVYTLIVKPDNTYEVRVDGQKRESGSLFEDWDFLPPKKIKDPSVSKPSDWVDEAMIDDPNDKKPDGWDDTPKTIPDPEAEKPEDWDDEADGQWEPPQIENPEYKGEWKPKRIPNPAYKGPWVHPEIDNPEYKQDDHLYRYSDFGGYPQSTSTEALKMNVHNEPVPVETARVGGGAGGILSSKRTISSSAVQKPISLGMGGVGGGRAGKENDIFVDIIERLTVLFNANGYVLNSSIEGCIGMKSYLSGSPGLRLALNEDLVVGRENAASWGGLVLDDANFHECVNLDDFETGRTLALVPPDGEFIAMNYRLSSPEFRAPFRIFPALEETSQYKVELVLRVRADFPEKNYGSNVVIRFPVPKTASTVTPELRNARAEEMAAAAAALPARGVAAALAAGAAAGGAGLATAGQSAEYNAKDREVVWTIRKFQGGTEQTLRTKITLSAPSSSNLRKELGPISMAFEIPMYNVSQLQVRFLRIAETHKAYKPMRWVRYVTTSNSYVCRL